MSHGQQDFPERIFERIRHGGQATENIGMASPLFLVTRDWLGTTESPPDLLAYDRKTAHFHFFEDATKNQWPRWWKRRVQYLHSSLKLEKPRFKKSLVNIHLVLPEKARPVQDWPWNDLIREVLGYPGLSFLQWGRDLSGQPILRSLSGEDLRFVLCYKPSSTESERISTLPPAGVPATACGPVPAAPPSLRSGNDEQSQNGVVPSPAEVIVETGAKENLSRIVARIMAASAVRSNRAVRMGAAKRLGEEIPESLSAVRVSTNGVAALAVGASISWGSLVRFLIVVWIGLKVAVALYRAAGVM